MTRAAGLLAAGALVVAALTGCTLGTTPLPRPEGHVVVWGWESAMRDTLEAAGVVQAFNDVYPEVEVEIVYLSQPVIYDNLTSLATTGELTGDLVEDDAGVSLPDVSLVPNSRVAELARVGALLDLTEQMAPHLGNLVEYKLVDCQLAGRTYCFPWDGGPVVMFYRRDVFAAAGLPSEPQQVTDMVATWGDYLQVCRTVREATGNPCFANHREENWGRLYEIMLWEQGLGYYDRETGDLTVDSPENVATLELMGRFWEEGLVAEEVQDWSEEWTAGLSAYEAPDILATLIEASWMDLFFRSWVAPDAGGLWGVARMPSVTGDGPRAANNGGSAFVIPVQAENPAAAWAFIELALGREESVLDMFAISGFIPSLKSVYGSPVFAEESSYFAGQNVNAIYGEVNTRVPEASVYGPDGVMMSRAVARAIQAYGRGELPAAEALAQAADQIRADLAR